MEIQLLREFFQEVLHHLLSSYKLPVLHHSVQPLKTLTLLLQLHPQLPRINNLIITKMLRHNNFFQIHQKHVFRNHIDFLKVLPKKKG